jgi:putative transposase
VDAFVKTHKRDYARLANLADAETAMRLLLGWFGDYKTIHPHFGLRMLAPRGFLNRSA